MGDNWEDMCRMPEMVTFDRDNHEMYFKVNAKIFRHIAGGERLALVRGTPFFMHTSLHGVSSKYVSHCYFPSNSNVVTCTKKDRLFLYGDWLFCRLVEYMFFWVLLNDVCVIIAFRRKMCAQQLMQA
jgi:hypothetical protein